LNISDERIEVHKGCPTRCGRIQDNIDLPRMADHILLARKNGPLDGREDREQQLPAVQWFTVSDAYSPTSGRAFKIRRCSQGETDSTETLNERKGHVKVAVDRL